MNQVPVIRFKGFTDPWEQRKFSEIVSVRRGLTYSPSNVTNEGKGVRVLRSSNIDGDRFVLSKDDVFVEAACANIAEVSNGDILITAANGSSHLVGKRAIIDNLTGKTVHGGFMLVASTSEPQFVNALMGASWYRQFLHLHVAGGNGAIGNLNRDDLANEIVSIPSKPERMAVGSFFRDLDDLIILHQRKYDQFVVLKKALLEKMFPRDGASVPEIRFAGFTDPWEQRKLGEILRERNERGDETQAILSVSIHSGISSSELGVDLLGKHVRRSDDKTLYKRVYAGDVVLNMMRAWQ